MCFLVTKCTEPIHWKASHQTFCGLSHLWSLCWAVEGFYVLTTWPAPFQLTPAHQAHSLFCSPCEQLHSDWPQHTKSMPIHDFLFLLSLCEQLNSDWPKHTKSILIRYFSNYGIQQAFLIWVFKWEHINISQLTEQVRLQKLGRIGET